MIKLRPIVNNILKEADSDTVTWGDVQSFLSDVIAAQKTGGAKVAGADIAKSGLKKVAIEGAKWAASLLTGGASGLIIDLVAEHGEDVGGFLLGLGKAVSEKELKNPKSSEFKAMTGPFWENIKLSSEISILLDDKIEKMFIDQVIIPKLQTPGSESEELPNMDELLGKWLNDSGDLKSKADIHFKGKQGDL